jgi:predicted regulator of Ras-like GTPase activity (Roadblock/LC7/MglB family)
MKKPAQADIQKWSDEVARDPRSLAFLPLARAYRRQGLRAQAKKLCLRGLEAHPSHADAHGLLALLHLEEGDHQRAADEWSMVLRVDADNFEALRGLGFCYLEQDQLSKARHSLEKAALLRPADVMVKEALGVLGTRQELVEKGIGPRGDSYGGDDPWTAASSTGAAPAADTAPASGDGNGPVNGGAAPARPHVARPATAGAAMGAAGAAGAAQPKRAAQPVAGEAAMRGVLPAAPFTGARRRPTDPQAVFDDLLGGGPLLGALLVDAQGLVLAGRLTDAIDGDAAILGAVLSGAAGEAARTVSMLKLGLWRGILLECGRALLHVSPAGSRGVLVLAAERSAPPGWLVRSAAQAAELASRFEEAVQ